MHGIRPLDRPDWPIADMCSSPICSSDTQVERKLSFWKKKNIKSEEKKLQFLFCCSEKAMSSFSQCFTKSVGVKKINNLQPSSNSFLYLGIQSLALLSDLIRKGLI